MNDLFLLNSTWDKNNTTPYFIVSKTDTIPDGINFDDKLVGARKVGVRATSANAYMFSFDSIRRIIDGDTIEAKNFVKDTSDKSFKARFIRSIFQADHPLRLKPNFHPYSEGVTWDDYEEITITNEPVIKNQPIKTEPDFSPCSISKLVQKESELIQKPTYSPFKKSLSMDSFLEEHYSSPDMREYKEEYQCYSPPNQEHDAYKAPESTKPPPHESRAPATPQTNRVVKPIIQKPVKRKQTINKRKELEIIAKEPLTKENFRARTKTLPADLKKSIVSFAENNPNDNLAEGFKKLLDPEDNPARNTRSKSIQHK